MPRVYLTTANHHAMPPRCVCCGEPTTNTLEEVGEHAAAKSSRRATMRFPVCPPCIAHGAYDAGRVPFGTPPPPRGPNCEGRRCFADFVSWKGSEYVVDFDSPRYARLFVEANEAERKRVRCDYDWIPPASRVQGGPGLDLGFRGVPTPPAPPPMPAASPLPSAPWPSPPPAPPPRRSSGLAILLAVVLILVAAACVVAMLAPAPPPDPNRGAMPSIPSGLPPAPEPPARERRRHRRGAPQSESLDTPSTKPR